MIAADVSSVARLLRGEPGKKDGPEIVTMDLLGGCGAGAGAAEDEVVDLEVSVPAGWERRLDLLSGKTFLTPRHPSVQEEAGQDLNLPPPASATATAAAAAAPASSSPFCTLEMVRSALERAEARWLAASSATSSTSSASTTSSSSSARKRNRSPAAVAPQPAAPAMSVAACSSCLTYVLIVVADPRCPRCSAKVPPLPAPADVPSPAVKHDVGARVKKPRIDLNAAADETE